MIISARFPSICSKCNGPVLVGQKINWVRGTSGVTHVVEEQCVFREVTPPPVIPNVIGIVNFLRAAQERGLKKPRARFLSPSSTEMRLSMSSRKGNEGAVLVKIEETYIGSIKPEGEVVGHLVFRKDVCDLLTAIAEDPASAAHAYGALMGKCSFCGLPITDAGSVEVGYGPICAQSYGLPWIRLGVPDLSSLPKDPDPEAPREEGPR